MAKPVVGIIMGSDSDLGIMKEAAKVMEEFGVEYELTITSAHRTTDVTVNYGRNALDKGLKVIIAGAGGAAHLPGMVAGMTPLPVIGVPIRAKNLEGLDSLLSIVQMPSGIPVATVAINGARNAGILAAQIIGVGDHELQAKVKQFQAELANQVVAKAKKLETIGYEAYLREQT